MNAYQDMIRAALQRELGTDNVYAIPIRKAKTTADMCFDRVRGNVRLMMGKVMTETEEDAYIQRVLNQKLP